MYIGGDECHCHEEQGGRGSMILSNIKSRHALQFKDILRQKQAIKKVFKESNSQNSIFIEAFFETEQFR